MAKKKSAKGPKKKVAEKATLPPERQEAADYVASLDEAIEKGSYAGVRVLADRAPEGLNDEERAAVAERGRFAWALSGGKTPWQMLRALADESVPWDAVDLFQVDERVAPAGHPDRNWSHVAQHLLGHAPIPHARLHPMPVEEPDLAAAAARYAGCLESVAGSPPVLDLVHLGLGADGHQKNGEDNPDHRICVVAPNI